MSKVELAKGVYWVGAIDWDLRYFHGYVTQRGSSYNSYLIVDEKVALIDTVKAPFVPELLSRIKEIIDLDKIDYLVSLHVENDHAGGIPAVLAACPNARLITSAPAGIKGLEAHFGPLEADLIKTGDILNLGAKSLHFVQTPMLHWPDNTMAFLPENGILFSSDAFGQHYASGIRFADEAPHEKLFHEAAKYYANIVMPYGAQTLKALDVAAKLAPKIIAPAHGLIWRDVEHIKQIAACYADWGAYKTKEKAVVVYDTMWGSTAQMATAITQAFIDNNIPVEKMALQQNHISDVVVEMLEAKYAAIGSPTLNNNILPTVAAFLSYIKGLTPQGRVGLAFGSYGWSGQSPAQIQKAMQEMGWQTPLAPFKLVYRPKTEDLSSLQEAVKKLIE